jgi:tetratricopeptide (TPR) repeat protein
MTAADLLHLVYDELRELAAARPASERTGHTLDATALVREAFLKLRAALRKTNRPEEAIREYRTASELDAKAAKAHSNLGAAPAEQSKFAGALAEYREVIRLDADNATRHNNLAWLGQPPGQGKK